jgi:hypothetical protein
MDEQQRKHLSDLRQVHLKRLRVLELQAASFGLSAPPHVLTEIDEIRENLAAIDLELAGSGPLETHSPDQGVISILLLSADPTNATRLRLGEEFREIQEKLKLSQWRALFKLEQRMSVRPADISQALLDVQPDIVHFTGHGSSMGSLYIEDLAGNAHAIEPDTLAALFEIFAKRINCVILNACYSEIQAKAIARHIPNVIGMHQRISDRAAIAFVIGFYQALGAGRSVEEAYRLGCVQIGLQGFKEELTPVLIRKDAM